MSGAQGLELSVGADQVLQAWPCARRSKTRGGPLCRGNLRHPPALPILPALPAPWGRPNLWACLNEALRPFFPWPPGWVVTVDELQVLHLTRAEHAVDRPRDGGGGLLLVLVLVSALLL